MDLNSIDLNLFAHSCPFHEQDFIPWSQECSEAGPKRKLKVHRSPSNCRYDSSVRYEKRLRRAASFNDTDQINYIFHFFRVNPNSSDEHGRTALHIASSRGFSDVVSTLIKNGANPNVEDKLGNTPLHLAIHSGCTETIKHLVAGGCKIRRTAKIASSPLELFENKIHLLRGKMVCPSSMSQITSIILLLRQALEKQNDTDNPSEVNIEELLHELAFLDLDNQSRPNNAMSSE